MWLEKSCSICLSICMQTYMDTNTCNAAAAAAAAALVINTIQLSEKLKCNSQCSLRGIRNEIFNLSLMSVFSN